MRTRWSLVVAVVVLAVAGCADPQTDTKAAPSEVAFDTSAKQEHITSAKVDSIAAELPA